MKRILACLLITTMLAGVAGCGNSDSKPVSQNTQTGSKASQSDGKDSSATKDSSAGNKDSQSKSESAFNETGLPIVNQPTTLKLLTKNQPGTVAFTETGDAPVWKTLSEKTGITFEVESYDQAELASKLALILSTNDRPDIYWQCWWQAQELMGYGSQGKLLALEDYIDKYGENLKEAFDKIKNCKTTVTMPDGHIYGYPSIWDQEGFASISVNDKWMKACKIENYPSTMDEFYNMLKLFKENDANENGDKNDEIPLTGANLQVTFDYILSAEGLMAYGGYEDIQASFDLTKDGKVFPIYTDDRYKATVAFFRKLYAEGLVDKDYLTLTGEEFDAKRLKDLNGVITTTHPTVSEKYDPANYTVLAPLTSADNSEKMACAYSMVSLGGAAIDAESKNKEVAVRFLDYCLSKDGSALWSAQCNLYNYDGVSADIVKLIKPYENDTHLEFKGMYGCVWNRSEWRLPPDNHIHQTAEKYKRPFTKVNFAQSIAFLPEESEVISTYKSELDSYVKERVSNWIIGKEDLDAGWDEYVKNCNNMGTEQLTKTYQAAYDRTK